jgi:gas vesicle protein
MDIKLQNEIKRLRHTLQIYHTSYVQELEEIEDKCQRLDIQIEKCTSDVKSEILKRQKKHYENQVSRLDSQMEINTNKLKERINNYEKKLIEVEKEKRSLDYNIEKLNLALERRNTSEVFDMFEYVTNAITILRDESSQAREPSS